MAGESTNLKPEELSLADSVVQCRLHSLAKNIHDLLQYNLVQKKGYNCGDLLAKRHSKEAGTSAASLALARSEGIMWW